MKKLLKAALLGMSVLTLSLPVQAIAPGFQEAKSCREYAATKYKIEQDQVQAIPDRKTPKGYYIKWRVNLFESYGYCLVNSKNYVTDFRIQNGPTPEEVALGPNEKVFKNLPKYGDVVINRGQMTRGDKQYFLLRPLQGSREYKWYARCGNNRDQVYDHNGKYVGFEPKMTVMFPYVCEVSPLSSPQSRPQPR